MTKLIYCCQKSVKIPLQNKSDDWVLGFKNEGTSQTTHLMRARYQVYWLSRNLVFC
jgi:hypothetical protein